MFYKTRDGEPRLSAIIGTVIGAIVLIILIFGSTGTIKAGQKGVYLRNNGVTGKVLDDGRYFKLPFFDSVAPMSIQINKYQQVMSCGTHGSQQELTATVTVNYEIDGKQAAYVYQQFGNDIAIIQDKVMNDNAQEAVKKTTSQYDASVVLDKRDEIGEKASKILSDKVAQYGIVIRGINIVNLAFSKEYNDAIEDQAKASKDRDTATILRDKAIIDAQTKAEIAKGDAEAIRITSQSLTEQPQYLELKRVEALRISAEKGVKIVPDTIVGSGVNTLYSVGK
jgi:regulator of protease activity HflC (stomatin/prohibitin superfamily)